MGHEPPEVILARMDERQKAMAKDLSDLKDQVAVDFEELKKQLHDGYVAREEFGPIRRLVWGSIMGVLGIVGAAIASLVVKDKP